MKRNAVIYCFALLLLAELSGCGGGASGGGSSGGSSSGNTTVTAVSGVGVAQGPLTSGSTVTITPVSSVVSGSIAATPITTTISALGAFSTTLPASTFVDLSATGKYFDEVYAVSTGTLTLGSFASSSDTALNVNILTTLAHKRIQNLVNNYPNNPNDVAGLSPAGVFAWERNQAESEVLAVFHIRDQSPRNQSPSQLYSTYNFGTLDLSKSRDDDHILAAISSIFEYGGTGNSTGQVSNLIASFQDELANNNGVIASSALLNALQNNANAIIPATVAANLATEYKSLGTIFSATNISDWLDQDGDHVLGKFKFVAVQAPLQSDGITPKPYTFPLYKVGASDDGATYAFNTNLNGISSTPNSTCKLSVAGGVLNFTTNVAHEVSSTYLLNGLAQTVGGTVIPIARYDFTPFAITQNPLKTARTYPTATTLLNGQVLVAGGLVGTTATAVVELYDPGKETWTTVTPMKKARAGHTATLLNSGKVMVVGGDGTSDTAELYDPVANTWTLTASPACGRTNHTATLLPNGQVLIAGGTATASKTCLGGGVTTPSAQASIEFYDPTSNTWDYTWAVATPQITPLPWSTEATAPSTTSTPPTAIATTTSATSTLQPILLMSTVRYNHTATYVPDCRTTISPCTGPTGGWVVFAGGFNGNIALNITDWITLPTAAQAAASIATPNAPAYAFNTPFNLNTASFSHSATLLTGANGGQGGQVLLAGGSSGATGAALARAELTDLTVTTPVWTAITTSQLNTPRVRHVAQLLSDGNTILFAGGATNSNSSSSSSSLSSVEIYDGSSFKLNGNLAYARDALAAAPISVTVNNSPVTQVLIVGGQGVTAAETFQ